MCTLEAEEKHLLSLATTNSLPTRNYRPDNFSEDTNDLQFIPLFDKIPWDDVLIPSVATQLSLKDLFNLRCVCKTTKAFVDAALEKRKEVNLSGFNCVNIPRAFSVISQKCCYLQKLNLARCFWLTDADLLPLFTRNDRLRVVNLNECVGLTSASLQPIIVKCKQLKVLKLSNCKWLTTGAVDALTLHQNDLEEFDISRCSAIGERCLCIFFLKLNKLRILSLAFVPSVTDAVLIHIANYCRALEHINLISCTAITDYGIINLTNKCSKLQSLMIQRCPNVTERSLAPLRNHIQVDRPIHNHPWPPLMNFLYIQV